MIINLNENQMTERCLWKSDRKKEKIIRKYIK